ncbi:Fungal specific transcription factor [Penicillium digitatum PHI26]|uniref:Fungal specific transcription factor n=2 Tax=Penicillium digitatum TaxID=36651 RepID=K9FNW6_PEND2|nr:Fungal specific transcription factor [Penicillium digitatum Pd1]EKV04418.1 Fungal specific transcription factor [Penicillium digitatum PHI26]EKV21750.1 Fungal specific transcription factor [Penicillium digitatum Pd1]
MPWPRFKPPSVEQIQHCLHQNHAKFHQKGREKGTCNPNLCASFAARTVEHVISMFRSPFCVWLRIAGKLGEAMYFYRPNMKDVDQSEFDLSFVKILRPGTCLQTCLLWKLLSQCCRLK